VTIREARARLSQLIEKALAGEDVVILRGSKHVVALTPITADDLELAPRLTDAQAARFWASIEADRAAGRIRWFNSSEEAVTAMSKAKRRRRTR
jgi:antitoxin (DNA-binding transcriptional repressor) of toxin-antitoxin stability system